MPRIGIDASRVNRKEKTGTENYSTSLIRALMQRETEHEFVLYSSGPLNGEDFTYLPSHVHSRVIRAPRLWTQGRLSLEMVFHRPDLLFIPSHTIPWVHPKNVIVTCHDLAFEVFPNCYKPQTRRELQMTTKQMVDWGTIIIAVSENTKKDLMSYYHARDDQIRVIYHGYNEEIPSYTQQFSQQLRASLHLHDPYIITVGRVELKKNILRLVMAYETLLKKKNISQKLLIVGKLSYGAQKVQDYIINHGLQKHVFLVGYLDQKSYTSLLAEADLFIYPSLYEGFGLPLLEAFACDIPVCASRTSSIPEVVGDSALLFDPLDNESIASTMYSILSRPALRNTLQVKGKNRLKKFSWEKCARETMDTFDELL